MTTLNPLESAAAITDTYRRYLQSLISPRDEKLGLAIETAIADSVNSENGIVKGPYLEATPPYVTGKTIRELVEEGVLSPEFLKLASNSFPIDRPTYAHQEQSIRKVASLDARKGTRGIGARREGTAALPNERTGQ
jgi:ATP-dependent helicase YprA (DUF1998 family)